MCALRYSGLSPPSRIAWTVGWKGPGLTFAPATAAVEAPHPAVDIDRDESVGRPLRHAWSRGTEQLRCCHDPIDMQHPLPRVDRDPPGLRNFGVRRGDREDPLGLKQASYRLTDRET